MSKEFFQLPESVKRRIWAELLAEWAKKSQGGRRRPFTLAFPFLLLIEAGRVLPGADRGRGRLALVPAAPDPPARGTGHGSRWHRSAGSILPFAGGFLLST